MARRRRRRHLNPKLKPYLYAIIVGLVFYYSFSYGRSCSEANRQEERARMLQAELALKEADSIMLHKALKTTIPYGWRYSSRFRDMNDVQLEAAQTLGFKPLASHDATPSKPSTRIQSCEFYHLDKLTHSAPVLVDKAACLLEDIGRNFADSLERRFGITGVCPIVTSVTRTEDDVKKLRRSGNVNASENSCHIYGTTFDMAYARFCFRHYDGTIEFIRPERAMMKQILAEVLENLRKQGRCYVKYEYKQACFHITARP